MTIALRAAGTPTGATGSATAPAPAYPAGVQAGDIALLSVSTKPYDAIVNTPAGWTLVGSATNGTTASSNDAGSTKVAVFAKLLDGSETGSVTVSITNGNTSGAVINTYSKSGTREWGFPPVYTSGGDTSDGANYSATGGTLTLVAGDWVHVTDATNSDAGTVSAGAVTYTGVTFGTIQQRTNQAVTTGGDSRLQVYDIPVNSITTQSGNIAHTFTNASSSSGTTLFVCLCEVMAAAATDAEGLSDSGASAGWAVAGIEEVRLSDLGQLREAQPAGTDPVGLVDDVAINLTVLTPDDPVDITDHVKATRSIMPNLDVEDQTFHVDVILEPLNDAVMGYMVTTPAGRGATLIWIEDTVEHSEYVNPNDSVTFPISGEDIDTVTHVKLIPDPAG